MTRLLHIVCAVFLASVSLFDAQAQPQVAAGSDRLVTFDTLAQRYVGPGVLYTAIQADMPWTIDVLEVDLENPYLEMETVKANDRLAGLERTSSMAARNDRDGHRAVGAVNGDFYGAGGVPISMQIADGQFVRRERSGRTAIGFDEEDHVMLGMPAFSGSILAGDTTLAIAGVNEERGADEVVAYNTFFGATTGTNQYGTELSARPLDDWIVNDTMRFVVDEMAVQQGAMAIPDGGLVLSGHDAAGVLLQENAQVGDTVRVVLNALPGLSRLDDAVAGGPYLVRGGEVSVGPRGDAPDRHPRTGVGFSADSTKLYLVTVDGRQPTSAGMSLHELASFMVRIGVSEGMNLDGGGSTTMVVRGDVVNSPSDIGGERSVSNALMVVSSAPQDELSGIYAQPSHVKVFRGGSVQFGVSGIDQYYNPVGLDGDQIEYTADAGLGEIDANGRFTAGMEADTGYVRVRYGAFSDSVRVVVKTVRRIELAPQGTVTDTLAAFTFTAHAFDGDSVEQVLDPTAFAWSTMDPDVGMVDASGQFRGVGPGETHVVATYKELADTSWVRVEVGEGRSLLAPMDDPGAWTLGGENIDLDQSQLIENEDPSASGSASLRLDYHFTYTGGQQNWIYLENDELIYGVPDSFVVDVHSDDGAHKVFVEVEDQLGRTTQILAPGRGQQLPTSALAPVHLAARRGDMVYPLTLRRVGFRLDSAQEEGASYEGSLYLDELRVVYPATSTATDEIGDVGRVIALLPNYPNPFHQSTRIAYVLDVPRHVQLSVYDVLGRRLVTLVNEPKPAGRHQVHLDRPELAPGVYFCRLQAGQHTVTRSMLVVR